VAQDPKGLAAEQTRLHRCAIVTVALVAGNFAASWVAIQATQKLS
jgi:hypothetical protein